MFCVSFSIISQIAYSPICICFNLPTRRIYFFDRSMSSRQFEISVFIINDNEDVKLNLNRFIMLKRRWIEVSSIISLKIDARPTFIFLWDNPTHLSCRQEKILIKNFRVWDDRQSTLFSLYLIVMESISSIIFLFKEVLEINEKN